MAFYISDLLGLVKWNPNNISKFRDSFIDEIARDFYWKRRDCSENIGRKVFDYADPKVLNSAIRHLAGLGVAKISHDSGNGGETIMVTREDREFLHGDVETRKIRSYVAANKTSPVVLSNFEVILSPPEDFGFVKNLIYGSEPISASTNLVYRIAEKSLRYYANNLGDINGFPAVLAEKSAHGILDNVSRTIRDIAAHMGEVTVRSCAGILVFKDSILMRKATDSRLLSRVDSFPISDTALGMTNNDDFVKIRKILGNAGFLYGVHESPVKRANSLRQESA